MPAAGYAYVTHQRMIGKSRKRLIFVDLHDNEFSPYDTDARYANKRSMTWTGYKVHITETCDANDVHLITNVETTQAQVQNLTAHNSEIKKRSAITEVHDKKEMFAAMADFYFNLSPAILCLDLSSDKN